MAADQLLPAAQGAELRSNRSEFGLARIHSVWCEGEIDHVPFLRSGAISEGDLEVDVFRLELQEIWYARGSIFASGRKLWFV